MRNNTPLIQSKYRFLLSLFLSVCFLIAQSATLWHSEIHDYHEHNGQSEYCDTFENLEKQSIIIGATFPLIENGQLKKEGRDLPLNFKNHKYSI